MRELSAAAITQAVQRLCIDACTNLGPDISQALGNAHSSEISPFGRETLAQIIENMEYARENCLPCCQDTGMAVVFLKLGQDLHIQGNLYDAINEGVRQGYEAGYLRKSVLDPLTRINTKDNTPAVIHTTITPGDILEISVAPKGAGSENMGRLSMLKPSDGTEGIKNFVIETVELAGANPCPPLTVCVGIGGTMEKAALLAKEQVLREIGSKNPDPLLAQLEAELLCHINGLGIGPMGLGGLTTALAVHIATYPTHIAELPVAVNLQCHAARHKTIVL
ncbi:MAG: fumarate hydratase [Christensenellales bacterium]|jgi:fumarate hydratase subunit alpha